MEKPRQKVSDGLPPVVLWLLFGATLVPLAIAAYSIIAASIMRTP